MWQHLHRRHRRAVSLGSMLAVGIGVALVPLFWMMSATFSGSQNSGGDEVPRSSFRHVTSLPLPYLDGGVGAQEAMAKAAPASGRELAQLFKLIALKARLQAEAQGHDLITFPRGFEHVGHPAEITATSERRMFDARRLNMDNQKAQLLGRIKQIEQEMAAFQSQLDSKQFELSLLRKERRLVETLHTKKLTGEVRLIGIRRDVARFEGEEGALKAQIARGQWQVHELELQIDGLSTKARLDAERDLAQVEADISEFVEQTRGAVAATRTIGQDEFLPRDGYLLQGALVPGLPASPTNALLLNASTGPCSSLACRPQRSFAVLEKRTEPRRIRKALRHTSRLSHVGQTRRPFARGMRRFARNVRRVFF